MYLLDRKLMNNKYNILPFHLYGDYPEARRSRNHNMVELGLHAVPTLRNRVFLCTAEQK